ncbi:MAG: hypothetical protein GY861_18290 [bacterium]|nr:hypothetical protein [bacterium]
MRYSEQELGVIKTTFGDNDERFFSIRKLMLQMDLNKTDVANLKVFKESKEAMAVLRKAFLPELEADAPIAQPVDLYLTLNFAEKSPEDALDQIMIRALVMDYIDQQLSVLDCNRAEVISFEKLTSLEDTCRSNAVNTFVNFSARNMIINHTEQRFQELKMLANIEPETLEEVEERMAKDSNK